MVPDMVYKTYTLGQVLAEAVARGMITVTYGADVSRRSIYCRVRFQISICAFICGA